MSFETCLAQISSINPFGASFIFLTLECVICPSWMHNESLKALYALAPLCISSIWVVFQLSLSCTPCLLFPQSVATQPPWLCLYSALARIRALLLPYLPPHWLKSLQSPSPFNTLSALGESLQLLKQISVEMVRDKPPPHDNLHLLPYINTPP